LWAVYPFILSFIKNFFKKSILIKPFYFEIYIQLFVFFPPSFTSVI
jgi:hypothetical protein